MNQENLNRGYENNQKITLGQKFKTTRNTLNMTTTDISDQLRIPVNVIEHIESDDYKIENLSVFILGYIRNYAKLLKIPTEEVNRLLTDLGWKPLEEIPVKKTVDTTQISAKDKRVRSMTYAIIVILITLVLIWHYSHRSTETVINDQPIQSQTTQVNENDKAHQPINWQTTPDYFTNEEI
jgi:cytoskeleton protein RodZ